MYNTLLFDLLMGSDIYESMQSVINQGTQEFRISEAYDESTLRY